MENAREINDRYSGKAMPAAVHQQIESLLEESRSLLRQAEVEKQAEYISEPQYKHGMVEGGCYGLGFVSSGTKSFLSYVRGETKTALVEDATGQNIVPRDYAGTIVKEIAALAVIRPLAYVRPTTKNLVDVGSVAVAPPGWGVLETQDPAVNPDVLANPPAAKQTITVHDLTGLAKIGKDELTDADESLAATIRQAVAEAFAEVEDDAFAGGTGDGDDMPWALTHNVTQGITAAVAQTPTPDDLKKLQFTIPARARKNARYLVHSGVEEAIALMKDNDGRYLLQPASALGGPPTLFGYPLHALDGLPEMSNRDKPACVFGDLRAGYMICDRQRMSVQRLEEMFALEGKVGLLFTMRVGGDVIRPAALARYLL